jgi:hypothetical protein
MFIDYLDNVSRSKKRRTNHAVAVYPNDRPLLSAERGMIHDGFSGSYKKIVHLDTILEGVIMTFGNEAASS